ncbi:kinase-like domain-containing protein [Pterulicium gracile]|uniref:Kinase-like domain-containing protein n=1 Tax=Pterulicium gracile TaxID=1884261 RepID=A0A5C3QRY5_9AGAR|nr:kinase-like domain-containing protein [Pterula gracilis]
MFNTSPRHPIPDLRGRAIYVDQIILHETLGKGAFGRVFRGEMVRPNNQHTQFAVKVLRKAQAGTRAGIAQATEQALHCNMGEHPNVSSLHFADADEEFTYLIMDYCPGGSLHEFIGSNKVTFVGNDEMVKRVFGQILDAVHHCHSNGVYHRDLKPDNILMSKDGAQAFVTDFGLSSSARSGWHAVGTLPYQAPECIYSTMLNAQYDHAPADVWALGVILCAIISNCRPWNFADDGDANFQRFRADPYSLMEHLPISVEACVLLSEVFELDPDSRVRLPELQARVQGMKTFFGGSGDLTYRRGLIHVELDKLGAAEMFASVEEPKWKQKLGGWFNRIGQ